VNEEETMKDKFVLRVLPKLGNMSRGGLRVT
jgi:hypothetical protein